VIEAALTGLLRKPPSPRRGGGGHEAA